MSAAATVADHGLSCVLVDECPDLGGQIYRRPLEGACEALPTDPEGDRLRAKVRAHGSLIRVMSSSSVWGVFEGLEVPVSRDSWTELLRPRSLILAPGAYELVPPFPGWTLPGVMTPGAAQILVKTMGVHPGSRVVLAGTGPFLPAVASQLLRAGVNVVAVIEASNRSAWWTLPLHGYRTPQILREGWDYLSAIRKARVPFHYRRVVVAAEENEQGHLGAVVHAPVDADWRPDMDQQETLEADTLCVSYGFVPRIHLAQSAGCDLELVEARGGWIPRRDASFRTTVPGIYTAGDGAGVAGAYSAVAEGKLAALGVAHDLGAISDAPWIEAQRPWLERLARFAPLRRALNRTCRLRPGLLDLVQNDTLVCRCEELTWEQVRTAVQFGGTRFRSLKVASRIGMGPCQGRICWPSVSRLVARECGASVEEVGPSSPRPPLRPISLGCLARSPDDAS